MAARTWALGLFCAFFGITAGAATGCSSKQNNLANGNLDASTDDSDSDASVKPHRKVVEVSEDAGRSAAGSIEETDAGSGCNANAVDDPDDDFTDTNCDGIDGNKKKAVFVATTGSDTADGSWGKAVATLKHAIQLAIAQGKDVYACSGDYKESLSVSGQSVRIYGGYDCTQNWVRNSNSQARLVSQSSPALVITGSKQPVVFDHVDVECASATSAGGSSIGAFISNSAQVTLRRGTFQAGDGVTAQQPAAATVTQASTVVAKQGNSAAKIKNCGTAFTTPPTCDQLVASGFSFASPTPTTWNAAQTPSQFMYCPSGEYSFGGGGGGTDPANCYANSAGTAGYPLSTSGTLDGLDGVDGTAAAAATNGFGTLDANGYQASNIGAAGNPGAVGQGGTGGRGGGVYQSGYTCDVCRNFEPIPLGGGGQGGPGGCGGLAGAPGNAGGASIAVAIYQSNVTIERATLQTGKGGGGSPGGEGAVGAPGITGGALGAVNECGTIVTSAITSGLTQAGGKGGHGGKGSQGGPGAGGPSIPLFASGTTPSLTSVTFLPGSGGPGGANGSGARAADGESADQKVLP